MITRADAEASAAAWARTESLLRGAEYAARVDEFDLGFAVTTDPIAPTGNVLDSFTSVIDRETGRVSRWPRWPFAVVQDVYRDKRASVVEPPMTADPEVQLRREARRKVSPGVAAHVTANGRVYIARGAKGDQDLKHHPLVLARMAEQTPGELVRGSERHAELIACSDTLHDTDRLRALDNLPPLTLDEARDLLRQALFERFLIREPGDPLGGEAGESCETCTYVLTQLALMEWGKVGTLELFEAGPAANPDPVRLPDVVAAELIGGGWDPATPAEVNAEMAGVMAEETIEVPGLEHRHQAFPAVFQALGNTGTLTVYRKAPGAEQRARRFEIESTLAAHSADLLHEFGEVIGVPLFPLGAVADESILAIDALGRVFDLDQAGEWFVADNYLDALTTLILGRTTRRVRDDGTW